ncbi:transcriptional regulator, MerR family [Denitrovibrio acetiphilus DSM 12809]|uniref:Transcriptional regulator, MerR family n=1 Tax=Denitrovibrio acetiphilus (strain DSM 12809 / NBRC 114555 / N2460) TaxID=522772 RepID=D4H149_DENA2|nr:MerR family transcriptional regulator [Denitrovibrio acetiphilus]ADD68712.1 transcriptional regulator, MerR family [Denitrovibrio acetiphilus DSM 12809]
MKIGELSKKTGCKVVTIRYYEKEGLLKTPDRTDGNYRVYGKDDQERLEFIMHCRRHGMMLNEIKELLVFREHPHKDCTWVTELLENHIKEMEEQIKSLESLKSSLEGLKERCDGGLDGTLCPIMKQLNNGLLCCNLNHKCTAVSGEKQRT